MRNEPPPFPGLPIMLQTGITWVVIRTCLWPASVGLMPMTRKPYAVS